MLEKLKSKKFYYELARDILVLAAIAYAIGVYQSRNTPEIAPPLHTQLITGEIISLEQMKSQSPILIYFWGSWCPICTITSSTITSLSEDNTVLTVALSSGTDAEIKKYMLENQYEFPVVNDHDGRISQQWGVSGTPSIFIINGDGEIDSVTIGYTSYLGLWFRLWLSSYHP